MMFTIAVATDAATEQATFSRRDVYPVHVKFNWILKDEHCSEVTLWPLTQTSIPFQNFGGSP